MTRGEKNNNPGNIDKGTPFKGLVQGDDARFCTFSTPVMGIRAIAVLLIEYYTAHGLNTIEGLINRWAPSVENQTNAYIADIVERTGIPGNQALDMEDPTTLEKLVTAIIWHENGECIYSPQQIQDGVNAAL